MKPCQSQEACGIAWTNFPNVDQGPVLEVSPSAAWERTKGIGLPVMSPVSDGPHWTQYPRLDREVSTPSEGPRCSASTPVFEHGPVSLVASILAIQKTRHPKMEWQLPHPCSKTCLQKRIAMMQKCCARQWQAKSNSRAKMAWESSNCPSDAKDPRVPEPGRSLRLRYQCR